MYDFNCSIVQYTLNPAIICFKNNGNYISFTGVKYIEVVDHGADGVYLCKLICKNYTNIHQDNYIYFVAKVEIS